MKKIVLFSPTGYVGRNLKERIRAEKNIQLFEMARGDNLKKYDGSYDILIYSAAIVSTRNETADTYVQDNVVTAVSIIHFCEEHNIKRIIFLSSDEIYGELNTDVVTDKTIMVNPNLYATTKYLAEKIIIGSGIPYYILRLPGIAGKVWGKGFIYGLISKAKKNEKIALYNVQKLYNNIVHIDDLTAFIVHLCNLDESSGSEIFLLGNTEKVLLKEIVYYVKGLCHSTSEIDSIETNEKRYFTLDVTKAVEYGYFSKRIWLIIDELEQLWEG